MAIKNREWATLSLHNLDNNPGQFSARDIMGLFSDDNLARTMDFSTFAAMLHLSAKITPYRGDHEAGKLLVLINFPPSPAQSCQSKKDASAVRV